MLGYRPSSVAKFKDGAEENAGWLLNYGYQFTDMFSGELAYGKVYDTKTPGTPARAAVPEVPASGENPAIPAVPAEDAEPSESAEGELIELSVLARMPGQTFSPFVRLGYSDIDLSATDSDDRSGSESDFLIGVGVDFTISESAAIRLEYNQADYGGKLKAEFERIQLGTIIRF